MDRFSTVNILMNLYTTVYDLHEELIDISIARTAIAYPMVEENNTNRALPDLPPEFSEHSFFILDSNRPRATVTFAFKANRMVNFNVQVFPKEWFKKNAIIEALQDRLLPYIAGRTGAKWQYKESYGQTNEDAARGLIHNVRMVPSTPALWAGPVHLISFDPAIPARPISVSASMVDRRYISSLGD